MTNDPARCDAHALTLIEVVLVVAILGVVSALAIPKLAGAAINYRLDLAVSRLEGDAVLAAEWARSAGAAQVMTFDAERARYTISVGVDGSGSTRTDVDLSGHPYACAMQSVTISGGGDELVFDRSGRPGARASVTLRAGGRSRTVILSDGVIFPGAPGNDETSSGDL